jgi:ubiquinone/menaquinone biosynthesis C-methylase UbiE
MNYFAYPTAAERYAAARPRFHPLVAEKIRAHLQLESKLARALDVACGTGHSTIALTAIAEQVIGTDISRGMLAQAPRESSISYVEAPAEQLPFARATFDLLTVSSAFHWLDHARFLTEAERVLRDGGWLAIYSNEFVARMKENPAFELWFRANYGARFPKPPRQERSLSDAMAREFGFTPAAQESYANDATYSLDEFITYLSTHSNIIAVVEGGQESMASVRGWLHTHLKPFFLTPRATFEFGGTISYFQKVND